METNSFSKALLLAAMTVMFWLTAIPSSAQPLSLNRTMSVSDPNRLSSWDWTVNTT